MTTTGWQEQVYAWCDAHDLSGLTPGERVACIVAEVGCSVRTAGRWERAWRLDRADVAPPSRSGGPRPLASDDAVDTTLVSVDATYLAALEAMASDLRKHLLAIGQLRRSVAPVAARDAAGRSSAA